MFKITYRNPLDKTDTLDVEFDIHSNVIAADWRVALKELLLNGNHLEKNFCMLGFPYTPRTVKFLCDELNVHVKTINNFALTNVWPDLYLIEDYYCEDTVRFDNTYPISDFEIGLNIKHSTLNKLHNHFEILQGTVENPSVYFKLADTETKYAIRQLNLICHELESLILSQRKLAYNADWVRPSQINTFINATRYHLTDEHRELFAVNGYDRVLGGVYMHWCQIGKTLIEVWRDENAPDLTDTVCDAINHLLYYSGEFDIEWGQNITATAEKRYLWWRNQLAEFNEWLVKNGLDPRDPQLSLGYLPLAQANLRKAFGTTDLQLILPILGKYLDVYKIEIDGVSNTFDYTWADADHKERQLQILKESYNAVD